MTTIVGRRELIAALGGAAAWPLAAGAQTRPLPLVGMLFPGSIEGPFGIDTTTAFFEGLHEEGYDKGRNIAVEYRHADGQYERLPALAQELVNLHPDVIVSWVTAASIAAKKATSTIPIVMGSVADPIGAGLVTSLARPGGNVTGTSGMSIEVGGKPLELLHDAVPRVARVAVLWNPANAVYQSGMLNATKAAAEALRIELHVLPVTSPAEIDEAFKAMNTTHVEALDILADPLFAIDENQRWLISLATLARLPSVTATLGYADEGGLTSYGPDYTAVSRRTGHYVGMILKGAAPGELPIERATKFDLVINLRTAKVLGLTIPNSLLVMANKVVE
jgi:putative tryptophan/tyrosine transport system substrate-binding protein